MQVVETLTPGQQEDPRFLKFTSFAQVIYNHDNPDKKNIPHIYGVDELGKKRHLSYEDVLFVFGRITETQGPPPEGYDQLSLPFNDDSQPIYEPDTSIVEHKATSQILATKSVLDPQEQVVLVEEYPPTIKTDTFGDSNTEYPIRHLRAARLGVFASLWLRNKTPKVEPVPVTTDHELYLLGLKSLEHSEIRYEDSEKRKNKKIVGVIIALGLLASAALLKHETDLDLKSMVPTTTVAEVPKEASIGVLPVQPISEQDQSPVEEPIPDGSSPEEIPEVSVTPEPVVPVDGGMAIVNPIDNELSPAVRVDAPEVIPEVGEPAVITFDNEAMPWTNAENLGVKDVRGFLQAVLDGYNAEYNRHFVWPDQMFWEGNHIMNLAELAGYNTIFQKMYSDL